MTKFLAFGLLLFMAAVGIYFLIELTSSPTIPKKKNFQPEVANKNEDPQTPSNELAMPEEDLKYLQQVEHLGGFVLGDLAFPKIKKAILDSDEEKLVSFFAVDFVADVFDQAGVEAKYAFAKFKTWDESSSKVKRDRTTFAKELIDFRNQFATVDRIGVKVMKMSPDQRDDLAGPWTGSLKIVLGGTLKTGGIRHRVTKFNCKISSISDSTPNEKEWFAACEAYSQKQSDADNFLMQNVTKQVVIDVDRLHDNWKLPSHVKKIEFLTGGVYLNDYNCDGNVDLLVTDLNGLFFYRGNPDGAFEEVSSEVGLPPLNDLGAVVADFDNDGFEDLIIGSQIFRNQNGENFVPLAPTEHTLKAVELGTNFSVCDYNKDGLMDIYVVGNMKPGKDHRQKWIGKNDAYFNVLWKNNGNWQFEDVTEKAGVVGSGSSTFSAVWFDANGDDWPDVMTSCEFGKNDYFLNQKDGTFREGTLPDIYGGFSMGITVNDIDNDGFGDVYVANMYSKAGERVVGNLRPGIYSKEVEAKMKDFVSGNELYQNKRNGTFQRIGKRSGINDVGWAYGVGYVDLNSDGLPDIYSPVGFQSVTHDKPDG